jgi:hypothetical protein
VILAEKSLPTCGLLARNNFRLAGHMDADRDDTFLVL